MGRVSKKHESGHAGNPHARKLINNGILYIKRNGKTYSALNSSPMNRQI